jgi:hypothetical protein
MTRIEHSPSETVHTEQRGITNIVKTILGGQNRDLLIGLLLGLSVLVNVALVYAYRDAAVQQELRRYDFANFKQTDWADLNTRVSVNEKLITMMGKCPKE